MIGCKCMFLLSNYFVCQNLDVYAFNDQTVEH